MSEPHLPPKRPYDSLFTPRQAPPAVPIASASRRPYDSLFTPGAERGVPPPPPTAGRFRRAYHRIKYAGPYRLPPLTAKIASYIPVFLLLWKGTEWTMNEIMVYNHPAFVPGRDGRLKYGGQASLFGTVGLAQEADGGISFARLKWAFNGANVIAASERTRRDLAAWPVLGWFEDMTAYFLFKALPGPLAAGLTPFAKRPWDEPEPCDK
ncbi:uncharacterized protein CcaverHIS019_0207430 [Cutaneotrichosporon cavernicola]|uniref:Uncharacterized protein n=1 Tax=Cutaneotrichosporon cavernicola TaxID=279322 RepID=A0AA48I1G8_9TREE|nr:uncharacterized protein CcaverHIS019_0207430 [Cutaneotrichosporon cavernicola]BEI89381.1 hypothetical protein CcaverHIS019_0207430 [Cutaneotrichosporon cavernicola]BEI97156.1 hypothetical protein CcaverHIS631_0207450 [Cutaneotrichosporon cavernicola]BEJ04929.1 hypothetical protein CcaverHIS641_0207460 [Cutaneotrichosporon cavernicola]